MNWRNYGPWALIVGGSEGLGASFARKLAAGGLDIVVVARKLEPLETVAADVRGLGRRVRTISADLAQPDALCAVRAQTDDIDVGLLIYNAGANNIRGDFVELEPDVYRSIIAITVSGQTEFVRHYGALMRARGRGGIMLGGSASSFIGSPTLAAYTGAKAFSRIFSEALWAECRPMGIDVLHMVIGFTDTPAMRRLGLDTAAAQSPDDAAQEALDNLSKGPLLILGGQPARDTAILRSSLDDRAALVLNASTPRRETMKHKKT